MKRTFKADGQSWTRVPPPKNYTALKRNVTIDSDSHLAAIGPAPSIEASQDHYSNYNSLNAPETASISPIEPIKVEFNTRGQTRLSSIENDTIQSHVLDQK